ncbi:MAG: hypothetical protein ACYC9U_12800 [Nitrososphaerales archaeon]
MFSLWMLDILISVATAFILVWLFAFYYRRLKEVRSRFTIGLALFCLIFLIQNVVAILIYYRLADVYSADVALPLLALGSLELAAFSALSWVVGQ